LVYVLVVDALAVAVVAATVTLVPVERQDVVVFGMLTAASVLHLELMRSIERLRELHATGTVYTDLKSIWTGEPRGFRTGDLIRSSLEVEVGNAGTA